MQGDLHLESMYGANVALLANRKSGYTLGMYYNCDPDMRMMQCLCCMLIAHLLMVMGTLVHTLVKCYTFVQVNKAYTLGQPEHLRCHNNWDLRAQTS